MALQLRTSLVALLTAGSLVISGCSGGGSFTTGTSEVPLADFNETAYEDVKDGGTFTTALGEFPVQQNTFHGDATVDTSNLWNWYNPIVSTYSPEGDFELNPDYITDINDETVNGKTSLLIEFNKDATFNDGTPIDWRAFKTAWTINQGVNPEYTPNSTDGYKHITSVSKGATAKEAKVVFDKVYPWWQSIISVAHPALENPKNYQDYVKKVHPEWGGGPYTVESIDFNKGEAVFVRNDKWWGKKGKLDKRIFRQMDSTASLNAFKNGEIDTTGAHLRERYAAVKNMTGVEIKRGKNPAVVLLELNSASPILQDVKVRKAIATALDRAQLAKIWYNGLDGYYQDPEGSFVLHSFQPGYEDNFSKVATFDPAQANALLDEAGWTEKNEEGIRTKDGKTLTVRYLLVGDAQTGKDQATATQKMLKDVGVDLSIESRTSADFSSIVSNRDFDILPLQFVSNSPDGVAFFEQTYGSDSELNKSGTGTKALDAKIAELQKLPTQEEQIARANELEPEALATFGLIPLQSSAAMTVQKEGLANVGQTTYHVVYPELVGWKK